MILTAQQKQASYIHIEGDIPPDIAEGTFISVARKPPLKIYSLGFQPAKSIPEIPRWFLQRYATLPMTVLEPFAGSGTTITESLKYGASAYWLDYHPLSRLICRVKTAMFSPEEVIDEALKIIKNAQNQINAPKTINFGNKNFWFQQPVQDGLEIIREFILRANLKTQPVLWLAFASTFRKTSDMNDGMLLAARRSHIKDIPKRSRIEVFKYFQLYVEKAVDSIVEWNQFLNESGKNAVELPIQDA